MRIQVLAKFWADGVLRQIGEILDVPESVGHEVLTAHKAILTEDAVLPKEIPDGTASEVSESESAQDVQGAD